VPVKRAIPIVLGITLFFAGAHARADDPEPLPPLQQPEPPPEPLPAAPSEKPAPATTVNPEPDAKPTREHRAGGVVANPQAGLAFGRWVGVPVQRITVGFELMPIVPKDPSSVRTMLTGVLEAGRTENGLGAHRAEFGVGVANAPSTFNVSAGLHLSYAMLVRATRTDNFARALFGNIGGFGLGLHAGAGVAIPLGGSVALTAAARALAEVYDGGIGWQAGPLLGVRF
jgi:hypothetical protein